MFNIKSLISGLAGAVALNLLHETLRKSDLESPRVDLLGEEALERSLQSVGVAIEDEKQLHRATLIGDIISNTVYYSLIGAGKGKHTWVRAAALGLGAGFGAVKLPPYLGLDKTPVARTERIEKMTIAYYLFGALVTASVYKMLRKSK